MVFGNPKPSRKKATLYGLLFSYSSILYGIISGIVLVPLYLKFISVELYGAWLATGNVLAWMSVVDPGISGVIMQRSGVAYGKGDGDEFMGYASSGILITLLICSLICIVGFAVTLYLPNLVNLSSEQLASILQISFLMAVGGTVLMVFSYTVNALNLGLLGSVGPGVVYVTASFGSLLLTALLILSGWGLYAIALGLVFRGTVSLVGSIIYFLWRTKKEGFKVSASSSKIRETFNLLSFTSIGKLGTSFSLHMDAFLISRFIGPETVPIYVLTKRGFTIAETLLNRTGQAVGVGISHLAGEGDFPKIRAIIRRLLKLNIWMLGMVFGGFFAFNKAFVALWVGEKFFAGFLISTLLCVYLLSRVLFTVMGTLCVSLGDIKRSSAITFAYSIVAFGVMLAGVYYLGILGAILAPLVGYSAVYFWYYPRSLHKRARMEGSDWLELGREAGKTAFAAVTFGSIFFYLPVDSWLVFGVGAGAYTVSYWLGISLLSQEARAELRNLLAIVGNRAGIGRSLHYHG